jgi:phosphatidylserine/phosphatidylglycerophosphate/cardiolipin synthase-like enzyme
MRPASRFSVLVLSGLLLCLTGILPAEPRAAQGVVPLVDRDFAPTLIDLIRHAESEVVVMQYQTRYYSEYPDSSSNRFLHELMAALDRGVRVRLVMDISDWKETQREEGEESDNAKNRTFARYLVARGAEVWSDPGEIVSHQKVVVVDARVSVIASHNWSFYSTDRNSEAAVMVWSPELAGDVLDFFDWYLGTSTPFEERADELPPDFDAAKLEQPTVVLDAWLNQREWMPVEWCELSPSREFFDEVRELLRGAQKSIEVVQNTIEWLNEVPPYAREDRPADLPPSLVNVLVDELAAAADRGVEVGIVMDWSDRGDNTRSINAASLLRRRGATVFYDDPEKTLHAKMLVVDNDTVVVGSTNWTFNAVEQGNEVSVIVKSGPLGEFFDGYFRRLKENGRNTSNGNSVPPMTQKF